ncbi:MAG: hypothetical protein AB7G93_12735 [Bdellovibrionales bacterium]
MKNRWTSLALAGVLAWSQTGMGEVENFSGMENLQAAAEAAREGSQLSQARVVALQAQMYLAWAIKLQVEKAKLISDYAETQGRLTQKTSFLISLSPTILELVTGILFLKKGTDPRFMSSARVVEHLGKVDALTKEVRSVQRELRRMIDRSGARFDVALFTSKAQELATKKGSLEGLLMVKPSGRIGRFVRGARIILAGAIGVTLVADAAATFVEINVLTPAETDQLIGWLDDFIDQTEMALTAYEQARSPAPAP